MSTNRKPRLLWVGDAVKQTGFARVTHNVVSRLRDLGWEVAVLGINYDGDPHGYPYPIYPAHLGGDLFGVGRLVQLAKNARPDVVLINNDPWIVPSFVEAMRAEPATAPIPVVAYMPVDAPNQSAAPALNGLDRAITYTEFGAQELTMGGYRGRIDVIPHGVDLSLYQPMGRDEARAALGLTKKLPDDAYIVQSVDRNQPRKRLDLTIQYWAEWWNTHGRPEDAFLYLHTCLRDQGWDINQLIKYYGLEHRIVLTNPAMTPSQMVPENQMRAVYSAADVHLSTTLGEGWGLTTHESAACGVAQILPEYSAYGEWMQGAAWFVPVTTYAITTQGINTIGGVADREKTVEAIEFMRQNPKDRGWWASRAFERAIEPRFSWAEVGKGFHAILSQTLDDRRLRPVGVTSAEEVSRS